MFYQKRQAATLRRVSLFERAVLYSRLARWPFLLLLFVANPLSLTAQTTSIIEGTVLDTQGRAIVDSEITLSGPVLGP